MRVLMVSDIHFDPFWDLEKVKELLPAPVEKWSAILGGPDSPDRADRFAALQKMCQAKGMDTDYALLVSSVQALRANASDARFVLASGDLLAHDFSCKYEAAVPHATADDYNAFAAKTLAFVMDRLRSTFPGVPVYAALGNNDSGCGDYRLDAGGAFLRTIAPTLSADVPAAQRGQARGDLTAGGYYSVVLPAPMERTQLLVLDDVFMSREYATCGGKPDAAPAAQQIEWLRSQLERARREDEKVWVMAHIPPGINPFSTIPNMKKVCAGAAAAMFLSSNAIADAIEEFGDVVRLAIFAHTHMDELRLLTAKQPGGTQRPVPLKMVPSVSPIHENEPTFVVASVDPDSAILKDYRVVAASNGTGVATAWHEEYDFDRAYGKKDFSEKSVERLIAEFGADDKAKTAASEEYLRYYYAGDRSALLKLFWPQYTCVLANDTAEGFRSCACKSEAAQ
ncbi:MAG TPA: metallophosphoesterase [Terracidiphilus sp.]|nr:metallophosphoesterase [Terracidiphilus sp.]